MNDNNEAKLWYTAALCVNCACVGYGLVTGNLMAVVINGFLGLFFALLLIVISHLK